MEQLVLSLENMFPGATHGQIATILLLSMAFAALIGSLFLAWILQVKFLRTYGVIAFAVLLVLAWIRSEMG